MAEAVGDGESAGRYRELFERGGRKLEELWNGEYYVQRVPAVEALRPGAASPGESWHAPAVVDGQIRYQYGDGCLSDQLLGEWLAAMAGLGPLLDPTRVRATLASIYRYNFRHDFFEHTNAQRLYALGDEKGLLLCSWPKGGRPALPFVYADEVWTGIEYQVAAHLIHAGHVAEGLALVRAVRDRYDGRRRNPWNEVECGAHYARALSSWSLVLALSGFTFSAPERRLGFAPRVNAADFRCFWSCGEGFGVYSQKLADGALDARLAVSEGAVRLQRLDLEASSAWTEARIASLSGPGGASPKASVRADGKGLRLELGAPVTLRQGESLVVELRRGASSPAGRRRSA
jgi:hypothetical protein